MTRTNSILSPISKPTGSSPTSKLHVIGILLFLNGLAWLAGSPVGATCAGGPCGSTFDFELLTADGTRQLHSISGPGSFTLHFDGIPQNLPSYCCGLDTTPSVFDESFTDNGDGTSTVEITAFALNGTDLYPSGLLGAGNVPQTGAALRIGHPYGYFPGSIPLTWNPSHTVVSATVDMQKTDGTSVLGGPTSLDPAFFFGAPGPWDGNFAVVFDNLVGKGVTFVDLRIVVATLNSGGACIADATTLCLSSGRFKVQVAWQALHLGTSGTGQAVPLTSDTGYFWFFGSSNVELVVKVLDGTPVNGDFWVFYGALSNVQYTITVTDTKTGRSKGYFNPQDTMASVADTSAFSASATAPIATDAISVLAPSAGELLASATPPIEPSTTAQLTSGCTADSTTLCLSSGRFKIQVAWQALHLGTSGTGQAVPLTSDTGYFWFFGSSNVELIIKVLDGTAVNGDFWVFYGALSNVQYTITVTDTATGAARIYLNPQDKLASNADTSAFSGGGGTGGIVTLASLGAGSSDPLTKLTITGRGFNPGTAAISVLLMPQSGGRTITVPAFAASPTTLTFLVPPLFNTNSGQFTSDFVNVQVVQVDGHVLSTSNVLTSLYINAPPDIPAGVPAGAITSAFLNASQNIASTVEGAAAIRQDLSAVASDLVFYSQDLGAVISAIGTVANHNGQSVAVSTTNGKPFSVDVATLTLSDRLILTYIRQFPSQALADVIRSVKASSGLTQAATTATSCPTLTGDANDDALLCSIQQYEQTLATTGSEAVQVGAEFEIGFYLSTLGGWAVDGFVEAGVLGRDVAQAAEISWSGISSFIAAKVIASKPPSLSDSLADVAAEILDSTAAGGLGILPAALDSRKLYEDASKVLASSAGSAPQGGLILTDSQQNAPRGTTAVYSFQRVGGVPYATELGAPTTPTVTTTDAAAIPGPGTSCTYIYSGWSPCQQDNTQTRTVISSSPVGCVGTPVLTQACTDSSNACCACIFDAFCTDLGPGGCWRCHTSTYSGGLCPSPWPNALATPGVCSCDPNYPDYEVCQ